MKCCLHLNMYYFSGVDGINFFVPFSGLAQFWDNTQLGETLLSMEFPL